jgi:4a-hydroxytetrahydrobiopterin dehydratase
VSSLADKTCEPCRAGATPLNADGAAPLLAQLDPDWSVVDGHHLRREVSFPDFRSALAFVDQVGALAEEMGHHPDLHLSWGRVVIEVWTHKIDGLHEADFVFAARCDRLRPSR